MHVRSDAGSVPKLRRSPKLGTVLILTLLICLSASCSASWAASAKSSTATRATAASVSNNILPFMAQQLSAYAGTQYGPFANGVWTDTDGGCWACDDGGPLTAAATLYVLGRESDSHYLQEAEQTVNTAISDEQGANGGFQPPAGDSTAEATATMWFGVEMGTTYHLLAPFLSTATIARWQASLAAAGNYLIASKNMTWWANGNINLGYTEFMWLVWQATGDGKFLTAYNNSWAFIITPPQSKFHGAGWITRRTPTGVDGAGGAGYFTETGLADTGFDPYYTTLQLDIAARLYLLSGDRRALEASNMIMNIELPRIQTGTWVLNSSDGTRHVGPNTSQLITSGFAVLGLDGGRTGLLSDVLPELKQEESLYVGNNSDAWRRGFGNSVATVALAAAEADPTEAASIAGYGLLGSRPSTATPMTSSLTPATALKVHQTKARAKAKAKSRRKEA
jgi:hypothetical protein